MKRNGKGKGKGKERGGFKPISEEEANEQAKKLMQQQIRTMVIRKSILEPIPEMSASNFNRGGRRIVLAPSKEYEMQKEFLKAFYDNYELKRPQIQNTYVAETFRAKDKIMSRDLINKLSDIDETLLILYTFELRTLIAKRKLIEKDAAKYQLDRCVISPQAMRKLKTLDNVEKGILRDIKTLHDQQRNIYKMDKPDLNVKENSAAPCILVDSHGQYLDKISKAKKKKRVCPIKMSDKTQEEIIKEFEDAFKVNNIQDMNVLYIKENLGAKPMKVSPERRDAQQHSEILSRLIEVMEADQLTDKTKDDPHAIGSGLEKVYGVANEGVKREDAIKTIGSGLEHIFGDDFDVSAISSRKPSENTSNAVIMVNTNGEIISKPEWGRHKHTPKKEL